VAKFHQQWRVPFGALIERNEAHHVRLANSMEKIHLYNSFIRLTILPYLKLLLTFIL
jgi:hypothetical protein